MVDVLRAADQDAVCWTWAPSQRNIAFITRHQVLVQPGWFYDFESEPYAIVSLLTPPDVFGQGISRLVDCAAQLSR